MFRKTLLAVACLVCSGLTTAADFSFADTRGELQTLARYRGQWVLLNLWATWCTPCLAEMPELEALSKSHQDVVVLGLAVDGQDARRVTHFAEQLHVSYPVIAGNGDSVKQFKTRGYPTSFLFDRSGREVLRKEGVITRQEVENTMAGITR